MIAWVERPPVSGRSMVQIHLGGPHYKEVQMKKNKSMEQIALPKMQAILDENGLQITLKVLIDSLDNLIKKRGKSVEGLLVLETLKGIHAGYCRRNEEDEEESDCC